MLHCLLHHYFLEVPVLGKGQRHLHIMECRNKRNPVFTTLRNCLDQSLYIFNLLTVEHVRIYKLTKNIIGKKNALKSGLEIL